MILDIISTIANLTYYDDDESQLVKHCRKMAHSACIFCLYHDSDNSVST